MEWVWVGLLDQTIDVCVAHGCNGMEEEEELEAQQPCVNERGTSLDLSLYLLM